MASMSAWYNSQYSTWNRTPAALARRETNDAGAVVINMGDIADPANGGTGIVGAGATARDAKKKQDSLFGPNIGIVSSGPKWTESTDRKEKNVDQLTPEIVKGWIEKSKDMSQPTTTLQALVNLKRPTIRLSPLESHPDEADTAHHNHALEFEYDCDAPKCGIYMHVVLPADHPAAPASSPGDATKSKDKDKEKEKEKPTRVLVFETVVDGGFGKILKLDEGATLELGRYENKPHVPVTAPSPSPANETASSPDDAAAASTSPADAAGHTERKKRFTNFRLRRLTAQTHGQSRSVSGPALAVVDAEPAPDAAKAQDKDNHADEVGVRVLIRLVALDAEGRELAARNEQITYLHVVRFGATPAEDKEDTRSWVVKVVKREATIGPHTFHLHEIYGLSSQSSAPASLPPTAPAPTADGNDAHTYPPPAGAAPVPATTHEDEPSSECLLCLSSPREVVLLPCRHLVACKECAVNMVEFGAGGTIVQPSEAEPVPADGEGAAEGGAGNGEGAGATPAPAPAPAATTRRKRKAKGWFCPVCRQPYTSLLRITTNPPTKEEKDAAAEAAAQAEAAAAAENASPARTGAAGLVSSLRPNFLRGLSRGGPAMRGGDLERGEGRGLEGEASLPAPAPSVAAESQLTPAPAPTEHTPVPAVADAQESPTVPTSEPAAEAPAPTSHSAHPSTSSTVAPPKPASAKVPEEPDHDRSRTPTPTHTPRQTPTPSHGDDGDETSVYDDAESTAPPASPTSASHS